MLFPFYGMQNENLETMGVQEMNASEMKEENGGIFAEIVAGIIIAGVAAAIWEFVSDVFVNKVPYDLID